MTHHWAANSFYPLRGRAGALFTLLLLTGTAALFLFTVDGRLTTQVGKPEQEAPQAQEHAVGVAGGGASFVATSKPAAAASGAGRPLSEAPPPRPVGGKSGVLAKKAASASVAGVDTRAKIRWDALKTNTEVAKNSLREVTFPYEGDGFEIKYLPEAQLFAVAIQGASSWQEYARTRKQIQDTFFRAQGVDPCKIHIVWATNPPLDSEQPSHVDLGCTTGDFLFP